jgi:hypothetical protein
MTSVQVNEALQALSRIGTKGQLASDYRLIVCTLRGIPLDDDETAENARAYAAANGTWAPVST